MDIINGNQQKFERYAAMVDRVYESRAKNLLISKLSMAKLKTMK